MLLENISKYGILFIGVGILLYIIYWVILGITIWRKEVNKQRLKKVIEQEALVLIEVATNTLREMEIEMKEITNTKSLDQLLKTEATQEDYDAFVEEIATWTKELYKEYKFQLLQPGFEDYESGYAVVFQMFKEEKPELFENLFKQAIDKGLTDVQVNDTFVKLVKEGRVVDLGDVEIDEVGTGMSSILQGDDLRLFITFVTPEYKEKKEEVLKEKEEKLKVAEEKREEANKKREYAYATIVEASAVLKNMTEEAIKGNPELVEAYEEAQRTYRGAL